MQFIEPSEEAKKEVESNVGKRKYDFPFEQVPKGKSFAVGFDQIKSLQILRTTASREGKRLGRNFRVILHENCYEVYYRSDRNEEVQESKPQQIASPYQGFGQLRPEPVKLDPTAHYRFKAHCLQCHAPFDVVPSKNYSVTESHDPNSWNVACDNCGHVNLTPKSLGVPQ